MGIVDEDIGRVRQASDIVAIVGQYTQLRRVGRRFQGLCPFHGERSPSFSVNAEEGLYYCFGCGVRGDVITFVREKEQLDFVGAVEWLANKANINLRYTDAGGGEERKRRARLQEQVAKAVAWYHDRLLTSDDAGPARSYLRSRGFDADMVRRYQVGWAPDRWDDLARALRLSNDDLTDSGLGFVNRRGRQQDAFRNRVVFPVFDAQGAAVGFGGRILPGGEGPKYKNSSESTIYAKSRLLYGLNWAKTSVVEANEVVVCEGYTDVIGFAKAGLDRAVATCGTALTEEHVKLLRRFARRVVLAFDADSAGQNAAARFYEWERAHDLDVAVADLPPGVDPGDLAQSDPERLVKAVDAARPFLEFRVERELDRGDLGTAEGRARAAERALAMVREHPDDLVRDQYAMLVASRCRLELDLVRAKLRETPQPRDDDERTSPRAGGVAPARRPTALREGPELEALRFVVHQRGELDHLIVPEVFDDELFAAAYRRIQEYETLHEAIEHSDPELAELLQRISVEETQADAMEVATLLWRPYLERLMAELALSMHGADAQSMREISDAHTWIKLQLEAIREPAQQAGAIADLLVWLGSTPKDAA